VGLTDLSITDPKTLSSSLIGDISFAISAGPMPNLVPGYNSRTATAKIWAKEWRRVSGFDENIKIPNPK